MADILQIWWIRHSPIAESGKYIGHTDIPALIPPVAANLAMPIPKDAIWYSSPMLRTMQTANWLLDSLGEKTKINLAPEVMEQNFGVWEGKTYDEVWALVDQTQQWSSPSEVRPSGGESFIGVCARVDHWLDPIIAKSDGTPIVIVAHAGSIRSGIRHALDINPEQALSFCVDYGSITQIEYFLKDNTARIMYVNR